MDLNPETNLYVQEIKDIVDCFMDDGFPEGNKRYDVLLIEMGINHEEKPVFEKYFTNTEKLDFSGLSQEERPLLESAIMKYCSLELKRQAEAAAKRLQDNRWKNSIPRPKRTE